jgi:hypothetical protein
MLLRRMTRQMACRHLISASLALYSNRPVTIEAFSLAQRLASEHAVRSDALVVRHK